MTALTPDHPAVDAAERAATRWMEDRELETDLDGTVYMLTAALPHLESATEENLARLRGTPVGRALMAEGWDALIESMSASGEFHDVDLRTMQRLNPYRKGDA